MASRLLDSVDLVPAMDCAEAGAADLEGVELVVAQRILVVQTQPKPEIDLMGQAYPIAAVRHNYYLAG